MRKNRVVFFTIGIIGIIILLYNNFFAMKLKTRDIKAMDNSSVKIDNSQQEDAIMSFQSKYNVMEDEQESKDMAVTDIVSVSPLSISADDLLWEFAADGSYIDLFIRKKEAIKSVLLTNMYYGSEYIRKYGSAVYGLRARKSNNINSAESRIINKKLLRNSGGYNFLVDSTPEAHRVFGKAFRIRIPRIVEYGYKSRGLSHGLISIDKGVTFNLRTYAKKYADNRGKFYNNPIYIDFTAKSYYNRLRPSIRKINSYRENAYNVVVVQYKSRINYVKYLLLRDFQKSTFFRRIPFISPLEKSDEKTFEKDKKAFILRAIRKKDGYVYITALVYLKDLSYEQEYNIAAIDEEDRVSKNYLSVILFPPQNKELFNSNIPKGDVIIIDNNLNRNKEYRGGGEQSYFIDR